MEEYPFGKRRVCKSMVDVRLPGTEREGPDEESRVLDVSGRS